MNTVQTSFNNKEASRQALNGNGVSVVVAVDIIVLQIVVV